MIDLLAPRWKCIGRYPQSNFIVGDIYTNEDCCKILNPNNVGSCLSVFSCDNYPAIFRSLLWYEDRQLEDMPPAVYYISMTSKKKVYWESEKWEIRKPLWHRGKEGLHFLSNNTWKEFETYLMPATSQDYITFKQRK